jgi:histidine ammonia-lyase
MVSNDAAIPVGDHTLSLKDVVRVARERQQVADLSAEIIRRIERSADWVQGKVREIEEKRDKGEKVDPIYGINTGFGANAGKAALPSAYYTRVLARNLLASHTVGVGEFFDEEIVRAAMLIRAHTLAQGYSGVRPLIIQKLVDMLNHRLYPAIPSKGSLGASGDLAPLSHLALVMSKVPTLRPEEKDPFDIPLLDATNGEVFVPYHQRESTEDTTYHVTVNRATGEQTLWQRVSGDEAMTCVGGQVELLAKEGLALNNGATFSAALAALTFYDARNLIENAELALSMTVEAISGFRDPFLPEVHNLRPHPGAKKAAEYVLRYTQNSQLLDPGDRDTNPQRVPPQDPYSVRCAPQVLGAVRDTLDFVQGILEIELNAATDNPLIFMNLPESRDYKTVSCGNFHGEPLAMAMDFLGIAITELGNIAERRIFLLTELPGHQTGFSFSTPGSSDEYSFLIKQKNGTVGLSSGLMLTQYTAASLVSDCKTLAHPDSVDSIPSSANKEDHVSMSLNAARHAREIVDNIEAVIAIEFLCAAQALDLRLQQRESGVEKGLGVGTQAAYERIREEVKYLDFDRVLYPDMRKIVRLVRGGELVRLARLATQAPE